MQPRTSPQILAGKTLRMMRQSHRVGLRSMATIVGISPSHLSRIESGERPATEELTARICAALATLPAPTDDVA